MWRVCRWTIITGKIALLPLPSPPPQLLSKTVQIRERKYRPQAKRWIHIASPPIIKCLTRAKLYWWKILALQFRIERPWSWSMLTNSFSRTISYLSLQWQTISKWTEGCWQAALLRQDSPLILELYHSTLLVKLWLRTRFHLGKNKEKVWLAPKIMSVLLISEQ